MKEVWFVKSMYEFGVEKVDSVYVSKEHAEKESSTDKYKNKHVWVDGPYELRE